MATGYTLLRQDEDIRKSENYDDTIVPSSTNYETTPADIEDDLNTVRSAINNLLNRSGGSFPATNWYDAIATPSTLETGTARGVNALNDALHAVEKKRVLRCVWGIDAITIASAGDTFDILAAGELPGNTTAAVGAVTTLGTVVAAHGGTFGTHSLAEVAGASAISPKNLVQIVDAVSRDPVLDAGDRIYGLLQTETATDGHTITDTTTTRVQISFVKINGTGTDLEAITAGAMDGVTYDYCYVERIRLEDLNEQNFLGGASIDVPAGASVDRQAAYDNQGTTPVDLTTNATIDLEGPGLVWSIRDDLEAVVFRVVEGSAGGTTEVQIAAATDTFNNDALANDFATGATFNSGGTRPVAVGETDGVVGTTAGDLLIDAFAELLLEDGNKAGSTFSGGLKLSDTTAEWDAYETAFGEVSILNAMVQAYSAGANPVRSFHAVTSNEAANADIGGPSTTANNLDADLPDALITGTFTSNHWLFLNGRLMRPGANSSANFDYYPSSTFTGGDVNICFERTLKSGDVIVVVYWP